jgi:oligoribonuclease NrnB/cAMP/cGMP phosphodiesterase (DHH superfamily)
MSSKKKEDAASGTANLHCCAIDICIYHAGCMDGLVAAWLIRVFNPDAQFIPAQYGDKLLDCVDGKNVIVVDFSYPRAVCEELKRRAKQVLILDHHKTAEEDLLGLDYAIFNIEMSGAQLVAHWLNGFSLDEEKASKLNYACKWLIDYTADRDLWAWKLPYTKSINACLRSYEFSFQGLNAALDDFATNGMHMFTEQGLAIMRQNQRYVDDHVVYAKRNKFRLLPDIIETRRDTVYVAYGVNATVLQSDICDAILKVTDADIAFTWSTKWNGMSDEWLFSLRSRKGSDVDVSVIARKFGGGGHKHAAGFKNIGMPVSFVGVY